MSKAKYDAEIAYLRAIRWLTYKGKRKAINNLKFNKEVLSTISHSYASTSSKKTDETSLVISYQMKKIQLEAYNERTRMYMKNDTKTGQNS
jgi:hypothetical protein